MIHVITKNNRHLYQETMTAYFRLRYKIFHDYLGWSALYRDDGLDIDQFDIDEAIYFLKIGPDDKILGGMRITPTVCDTQLKTIFREHCTMSPPPSSLDNWEMSRYFVSDPNYKSKTGHLVKQELYVGLIEYALANGVTGLSGFMDSYFAPRAASLPWEIDYLGLHTAYGKDRRGNDAEAMAINLAIDEEMLANTKSVGVWDIQKPVLSPSLGLDMPIGIAAQPAEVLLLVDRFAEAHPEHLEVVKMTVQQLGHHSATNRAAAKQLLAEWENDLLQDHEKTNKLQSVAKPGSFVPLGHRLQ